MHDNEEAYGFLIYLLVGLAVLAVIGAVAYYAPLNSGPAKPSATVAGSTRCECDDLQKMQDAYAQIEKELTAWKEIQQDISNGNSPATYTDATKRFTDKVWGKGAKTKRLGNVNEEGEIIIDDQLKAEQCRDIVYSYMLHEWDHLKYKSQHLDNTGFASVVNNQIAKQSPTWWVKHQVAWEIRGREVQAAYLKEQIGILTPQCQYQYECKKGSGKYYSDVMDCLKNCVRKIATLDNWCWEYDPESDIYTGKKY
jgi:hypothetical protein